MRAVQAKALNGGQKRGGFDDDLVARRNQCFADQIERLLAAGGDDQTLRRHLGPLVGHEPAQCLAQWAVALGGAILQDRAGVVVQHGGGGFPNALDIKQRRVRKASGKTDDSRLAQELEELANGGGFYGIEAVGKLHGFWAGWVNRFEVNCHRNKRSRTGFGSGLSRCGNRCAPNRCHLDADSLPRIANLCR